MIGAFRHWSCSEGEVSLRSGDLLVIYSDGVTEAESPSGQEFGEDRLVRCLRESQALPARSVVHCIVDNVTEFSHGSRYDDVTVLA